MPKSIDNRQANGFVLIVLEIISELKRDSSARCKSVSSLIGNTAQIAESHDVLVKSGEYFLIEKLHFNPFPVHVYMR
jgi:hypothetical protein